MSILQVGLVDTTGQLDPNFVHAASLAMNLQVTRDLPQFWPVNATVAYLPDPDSIPAGVWPVLLVPQLPDGEGGVHMDKHKQPYALVVASAQDNTWTVAASHEILEMLVDPWGSKLQSSVAIEISGGGDIQDSTGQFNYLAEACDPCEANQYAYTVNGVIVSDFITPRFYDPVATTGTRYSFTGAIQAPRQILPGGYISFVNLQQDVWQQILWTDPSGPPELKTLPDPAPDKSLREWIDSLPSTKEISKASRRLKTSREKELVAYSAKRLSAMEQISHTRACRYSARAGELHLTAH